VTGSHFSALTNILHCCASSDALDFLISNVECRTFILLYPL